MSWVQGHGRVLLGAPSIFLKCQNCPSFVLDVCERVVRKRFTDQVDPYVDILNIRINLIGKPFTHGHLLLLLLSAGCT